MPPSARETLEALRRLPREAAARAHVPYSQRPTAAVLLLEDGRSVPGVRVESASFSLLIPALVNAFSTAVACGRTDVAAVAMSRAFLPEERALLHALPWGSFIEADADVFVRNDLETLPALSERLSPYLEAGAPQDPAAGVALAREVARRAHVPESGFPVGCVLETAAGELIPGVNVEHTDWARILCAERNALGTAISYGLAGLRRLYLTCLKDPTGTPCGACRQLLVELAPEAALWMDRGDDTPEAASPHGLLPGSFSGRALAERRGKGVDV